MKHKKQQQIEASSRNKKERGVLPPHNTRLLRRGRVIRSTTTIMSNTA